MKTHPHGAPGSPDDPEWKGAPLRRVLVLAVVTFMVATAATRVRSRNGLGSDGTLTAAVGRDEVKRPPSPAPTTVTATSSSMAASTAGGRQKKKTSKTWKKKSHDGVEGDAVGDAPKPTAFVLGVQKCGSSSVSADLKLHPDLIWGETKPGKCDLVREGGTNGGCKKELHYFSSPDRFKSGLDWYNSWFKSPLPTPQARYIEGTPAYFYDSGHTIGNMVKAYGRSRF